MKLLVAKEFSSSEQGSTFLPAVVSGFLQGQSLDRGLKVITAVPKLHPRRGTHHVVDGEGIAFCVRERDRQCSVVHLYIILTCCIPVVYQSINLVDIDPLC